MKKATSYPNIDMIKTGKRMKYMLESAGYTPRMIQEHLHLSCVQPVYRWYKGQILPTVNHLLLLSDLLNVHMEDFLVKKSPVFLLYDIELHNWKSTQKRQIAYYEMLHRATA